MTYSSTFAISLGSSQTGLTLEAQLKDSDGVNVGAAITAGFFEVGVGNYIFKATAIPDGHRGIFVFQVSPGGAVKAIASVNPEELENTDVKTSTRSDFDEATDNVTVGTNNDKTGYDLNADQSAVTVGTVNDLGAAAKTAVNAEVADVMTVDTIVELPVGQPPANPTFAQAAMLDYMGARNERETTAGEDRVKNDAGTVVAKATVSDDGSSFKHEKMVSG